MVLEEMNIRIKSLSDDIKNSNHLDSVKEFTEVIVKFSQLVSSVTSSLEIALDTVLKQNMTMACNMLLTYLACNMLLTLGL